MKHSPSLIRTVGTISSATSVSRVAGLLRDQVMSFYFGVGPATDAFVAAFRVPNLLRDLFAEGALSAAFVPTFTHVREHHGSAAAWRLANRLMSALVVILGLLSVGIAFGAPAILRVYVTGFDPQKMALSVVMTRILAPFLLFVALAAVAMGVLNTCGRFFLPAFAPTFFNGAAIAGMVLLVPLLRRLERDPALALAIGALVGGVLQFAVQIPALRAQGFRFHFELALSDPALRRIARLMVPATFGLAATQLNILVDTALASSFGDGPMTYLALSFRLMQLPIGLFGVAIGTANLARVSADAARDDVQALRANLAAALRAAALLTLPATCGLIALRTPITRVLFEHGRFTASDTARMAPAILCYALGLFAYAVTKVQVPTFYALGDTRTPVWASALAVTAKIGANFALIGVLRRAGVDPFLGLALSTSLAAWINCLWLGRALRRHLGPLAGLGVGAAQLGGLALSAATGLAAAAVHAGLERVTPPGGIAAEIMRLSTAIAAAMLLYGWALRFVDAPEAAALRALWHRRRRRPV